MFEVAERLRNIKVSASAAMTRKVRELRAQGVKIVGLSSGEPDFPTPTHAIEAAHKAALAGETKYPPQDGIKPLKEAIQRKFKRDNNLDYALEEIMVSNGSKQIMYDALMASVNPGDEVIIPAPGWISYADQATLAGATPVSVSCPENNHFKLRAVDLEAAITPRTKWVVLGFWIVLVPVVAAYFRCTCRRWICTTFRTDGSSTGASLAPGICAPVLCAHRWIRRRSSRLKG